MRTPVPSAPRRRLPWFLASLALSLAPSLRLSGADAPSPAATPLDEATALVAEGAQYRLWTVYPPEKVAPDTELPAAVHAERLDLSLAGGEYEAFQLVLRTTTPWRTVEPKLSDLTNATGGTIAAANIAFRRVAWVYVDTPSGTNMGPMPFDTGVGFHPDPLPSGGDMARPRRNLCFWVTVHVPHGTVPGTYEGQVEIQFRRESWMPKDMPAPQVPLRVQVRRFELPEPSPLRNTAYFHPQGLPADWTANAEWMKSLYGEFATHYQTPEPILPSPKITVDADGKISVDTKEWEETAKFCLDELKASHLFVPVWTINPNPPRMQGIYFLWHYPAVTKQRWQGQFICDENRQLRPEFKAIFGPYLNAISTVVKAHGWQGRVLIATMDEPYTYHTDDRAKDTPQNNYEVVRNYVEFVRSVAPELRTFITADPVPELAGSIDHWCIRTFKNMDFARDRAQTHGDSLTFCDNYRTFIDFPMVSARTLGWLAWKVGAQGWLTYETLSGFWTAWEGPVFLYPLPGGQTVWGMGHMFYPEPCRRGIVPSVRWEMMREGCEDYLYLWLLRERVAKLAPDQADSEAATEARKLLADAASQVVGTSGEQPAPGTERRNTQSNSVPHRLRLKIADLIEKLGE